MNSMPCFVKDFSDYVKLCAKYEWQWFCARACKAWNVYRLNWLNYVNDQFWIKRSVLNRTTRYWTERPVIEPNDPFLNWSTRFELNVPSLNRTTRHWTDWPLLNRLTHFWIERFVLNRNDPFFIWTSQIVIEWPLLFWNVRGLFKWPPSILNEILI